MDENSTIIKPECNQSNFELELKSDSQINQTNKINNDTLLNEIVSYFLNFTI